MYRMCDECVMYDVCAQVGEEEARRSVEAGVTVTRLDGGLLSPYDLKRLQVSAFCHLPRAPVKSLLPRLALYVYNCNAAARAGRQQCGPSRSPTHHSTQHTTKHRESCAQPPWALTIPVNTQAYANNLVDYHLVLDLLPPLTAAFFTGSLPTSMSYAQVGGC